MASEPNPAIEPLGRQLSIYSLTLDEFQNTLSDNGKGGVGSMNMDEFLNSIWTAEENHGQGTTATEPQEKIEKGMAKQGSRGIPQPLCNKTVDQVWSEIRRDQQNNGDTQCQTHAAQNQLTFRDMTLEDFLVRAGIDPEPAYTQPAIGMYPAMGPRPIMAIPSGAVTVAANNLVPYQQLPQNGGVVEVPGGASGYAQTPLATNYGNGAGGGFGQVQGLGMGSPVTPALSEGPRANQADSGKQCGLDANRDGTKQITHGSVEKVIERRQRRMIKNRESAARSRARKQAYTVELEAELNQLREENAHLRQTLIELEKKRKRQYYEETRARAGKQSKANKANEKLKAMRRSLSCLN